MKPRFLAAILLSCAAVPLLAAPAQTGFALAPTWVYQFITLPAGAIPHGINNNDEIVGVFNDFSGRGFVLLSTGLEILTVPDAGGIHPLDLNDHGTVVGYFQRQGAATHAFTYSNGTLVLSPFGESPFKVEEELTGINNDNVVTGWSATQFVNLFSRTCLGRTLTAFDPNNLFCMGNNDAGKVLYTYAGPGYDVGFLLAPGGSAVIISHEGATDIEPDDVNNHDMVVGSFSGSDAVRRGFVWANGKSVTLDYPGATRTDLTGVNDAGMVVGWAQFEGGGSTGFVAVPRSPVDVTINGVDGPLTLDRSQPLRVDLSFQAPPSGTFDPSELYIGVAAPLVGVLWLNSQGQLTATPTPIASGALPSFGPVALLDRPNTTAFPVGTYTWFMVADDDANGVVNGTFYDLAQVTLK